MSLSQNLSVRVKYPYTLRSPSHRLLVNTPPTSPSSSFPSLASDHLQTPASKIHGGYFLPQQDPFTLQQSDGTSSSLPAPPFGLGGAGLGMPKMAVNYPDGVHQAALKGSVFLVRGWNATEIRVNKERSRFWWDAGRRGWRMWTCERVESCWTDWNGVGLRAGGSYLIVRRVTLVGAMPFICVFVGVVLCPSWPAHSFRDSGMGQGRSFHECMTC